VETVGGDFGRLGWLPQARRWARGDLDIPLDFVHIAKNRLRCQVHYKQALIHLIIPPAFTINRIELAFALGVVLETRVSVAKSLQVKEPMAGNLAMIREARRVYDLGGKKGRKKGSRLVGLGEL
jgi:hypothetical protein